MPFDDFLYFVSYARDDYYIVGSGGLEENAYLKQFFADLRETVRGLSGRAQTDPIDYRDTQEIDLGQPWRGEVVDGLQHCRCLLALYTPLFFNREECGREVRFLQLRTRNQYAAGAEPHSFIVPVIWETPHNIPESLQPLNYFEASLPPEYKQYGLRVLAQQKKFADQYRAAVDAIAGQIEVVRTMERLKSLAAAPELVNVDSAFIPSDAVPAVNSNAAASNKGPSAVRFAYIVATTAEVQNGKTQFTHYGDSAEEWRPSPIDIRGLGLVAPPIAASSQFYQKQIELTGNVDADIEKVEKDRALLVLLVDVWSVCALPKYLELIRKYDARPSFHVASIVIWADGDPDVEYLKNHLAQRVRYEVFRYSYQRGAPFFRPIVRGLSEFESSLRETLERLRMEVMTRADAVRALEGIEFCVRPAVSGTTVK